MRAIYGKLLVRRSRSLLRITKCLENMKWEFGGSVIAVLADVRIERQPSFDHAKIK